MISNQPLRALTLAALLALVAGCPAPNVIDDGANGTAVGGPGGQGGEDGLGGASTTGTGDGSDIGVFDDDFGAGAENPLDTRVIYFGFDRSEIRPEFNAVLAAHAEFLTMNPNSLIRLEGHADETGSREYNIGLGERRAQSVRRFMMLQGAAADQLTTVSYGEERPAAFGSDPESYSLNRRVELIYR